LSVRGSPGPAISHASSVELSRVWADEAGREKMSIEVMLMSKK
jgi:hypothetical protein